MKILYFVSSLKVSKYPGVMKKIQTQLMTWNSLSNVEANAIILTKETIDKSKYKHIHFIKENKFGFHIAKVFKVVWAYKADILYMRYILLKPYYYLLQKFSSAKKVFEINTNDINEIKTLSKKRLLYKFIYIYNRLTRGFIYRNSDAMVFVTHELSQDPIYSNYKKESIVIPNNIDTTAFEQKKKKANSSEKIQFFFIGASNLPWHGCDKLLTLAKYLKEDAHFHIVGPDGDSYENVTFYGYKTFDDYVKIAERCHIGIGSLALHRYGLNEACTLKTREYLALGLPIVISYEDTAFINKDVDYIYKLENTESNITAESAKDILEFAKKNKDRLVGRKEVDPFIDTTVLEKRKIDFISKLISNKKH